VNDRHFGAEFAQNTGRGFVSRAVGDIDRDTHSFERHVTGETAFREFNSAQAASSMRARARFFPQLGGCCRSCHENEVPRLRFDLVVEFVAIVPEKFDTVFFVRIMRSGTRTMPASARK